MKKFLLFILLLANQVSFGQATFQELISSTYGNYNLQDMDPADDGGCFIIANFYEFAGNQDYIFLARMSETGSILWSKEILENYQNWGYSVSHTDDGGCSISGVSHTYQGDYYLLAAKFDSAGNSPWGKRYTNILANSGTDILQTNDRGFIIVGTTHFIASPNGAYIIKTDTAGNIVWTKSYSGNATNYYTHCVRQTTDSGYIICGSTEDYGGPTSNVFLIKTNFVGDVLWSKEYGGLSNDYGYAVEQMGDSGYIVVGSTSSFGAGSNDVYIIKTNSDGDVLWSKTYGGAGYDEGVSIKQTSDSGYIISGSTSSFSFGAGDMLLIKINTDGDTLWTATYGGTSDDWASSAGQARNGGYLIAGYSNSFSISTAYLVKTDYLGNSYCNQGTTKMEIKSAATAVSNTNLIYYFASTATPAYVGGLSGGSVTSLCTMVGIESSTADNISIYPNPATDRLIVQSDKPSSLSILTPLGQTLCQSEIRTPKSEIDISSLSSGIYFLQLKSADGSVVKPFVKE